MLRTIGSTLLAKSQPGAALRRKEEFGIEKPDIPGKGQAGTLSRSLIEEPLIRQTPPGSEKIVSVQPTIEGTTVSPIRPLAPIPEAVGSPTMPSTIPQGAQNQALFKSISPPSQAPAGTRPGQAATVRSEGPIAAAKPAATGGQVKDNQTSNNVVKAQAPTSLRSMEQILPWSSKLGLKTIAADEYPQAPITYLRPTTGQQLAGTAGNIINRVGNLMGNPFPERGVSEKLQTFGGAPTLAQMGVGSLRSYNPVKTFQSNVQKATGFLRSLFR